ncbi:MAG: hypothetical protein HT580_00230 [Dechloromonas sp.]|nr:MAG: hypothetical protein HT580_00230 [Dechloromonas sp.]
MKLRRIAVLLALPLALAHTPVAQAQTLPAQLLLNAASWAFQKMMEEAGKPADPYAVGNSFDGRRFRAALRQRRGFGCSVNAGEPSYVPSISNTGSFDAGNAYQTSR